MTEQITQKENPYKRDLSGGTEKQMEMLFDAFPEEFLNNFQIIPTRMDGITLDPQKIRIAYIHDLPDDPAVLYLRNNGWNNFHLIVFVSNWQMQAFIERFQIPWSRCMVIQNSIEPLTLFPPVNPDDRIKLVYTPTPHRGLGIAVAVFLELLKKYQDKITLDVYSSFKLYGWEHRDEPFEELFKVCRENPSINYHGSIPHKDLMETLPSYDIFAYPAIWKETSCRCLIEAMSAGLLCVHSNLAALPETAANFTNMYQYQDRPEDHAQIFFNMMDQAIQGLNDEAVKNRLTNQKLYIDNVHNWAYRKTQWANILNNLVTMKNSNGFSTMPQAHKPLAEPGDSFTVRTS